MNALLGLITEPEPDHPLRADLAEEFTKDRKKFNKTAEDYTKKYAVKRPDVHCFPLSSGFSRVTCVIAEEAVHKCIQTVFG
ncbi:hypothetical protein WUBG_04060 [Wuchereria bancrofti]|nr:hypothetical protein WUBG_04060 [Wuchereria bancrofti]